jgi:hypothetical protein
MRSLPVHGEPAPVAQASIRSNLHEPLDIQGHRFAQVPFDHPVPLDDISDAYHFIFRQVLHFRIEIKARFLTDLGSSALPNSINVGQTDLNSLIQWQIHSCDSSQFLTSLLALTLLVLGI